jgi:hypothetical protein
MTGTVLTLPRAAMLGDPHRPAYRRSGCRHQLQVHGSAGHRIFFEIDPAPANEPVIDRACPQGGHDLPGKAGGDRS